MGLMERLRRAEEQGKHAARRGLDKARSELGDAQRRIRQKMRIYPRKKAATAGPLGAARPQPSAPEPERRPIVSIGGKDVGERELPRDRRIA